MADDGTARGATISLGGKVVKDEKLIEEAKAANLKKEVAVLEKQIKEKQAQLIGKEDMVKKTKK